MELFRHIVHKQTNKQMDGQSYSLSRYRDWKCRLNLRTKINFDTLYYLDSPVCLQILVLNSISTLLINSKSVFWFWRSSSAMILYKRCIASVDLPSITLFSTQTISNNILWSHFRTIQYQTILKWLKSKIIITNNNQ